MIYFLVNKTRNKGMVCCDIFKSKKCRVLTRSYMNDNLSPCWIFIYLMIIPLILILGYIVFYTVGTIFCSMGIDIPGKNEESLCDSILAAGLIYTFLLIVPIVAICISCYRSPIDTIIFISLILAIILFFYIPIILSMSYSKYINPIIVPINRKDNTMVVCHEVFADQCYGEGFLMLFILLIIFLSLCICYWIWQDFKQRYNQIDDKLI